MLFQHNLFVNRIQHFNKSAFKVTDIMKKFSVAPKYKKWDTNVWIKYVKLATDHKAINLGQGFADYQVVPNHILKAFQDPKVLDNHALFQYTRGYGHVRLVQALSKIYNSKLKHNVDPMNNILVTVGAYGSLYFAIEGLIMDGDEVIIIEPFFDCYQPMVEIAGGTCVFIPLKESHGTSSTLSSNQWLLDFDELESKITKNTKAIILNTPNNPLGKVFTLEELEKISAICQKYDIMVISDEVYEWLVYEPQKHISIASLPGMWDRTLTIGSVGKTFNATGFKLGWTIGPNELLNACRIVSQNSLYTSPTITQEISAIGFENEIPLLGTSQSYFNKTTTELLQKRDEFCRILNGIGMRAYTPEGGYFVVAEWAPFAHLIGEDGENTVISNGATDRNPKILARDEIFAEWLCVNKKLATIPCSAFYSDTHKHIGEKYIRFCFFKKPETLKAAEEILKKLPQK